jgi:DNA replication protein DnaC
VKSYDEAVASGRLQDELRRLGRYPLLVIEEVGYIPFECQAASLFFQRVSARWDEVFSDDTVATAIFDLLADLAEVMALEGDSYRLKNGDLGQVSGPTDD